MSDHPQSPQAQSVQGLSVQGLSVQELIETINPEIHMNLKTAIELGRWSNGERLSQMQLEHCMQAVIAYEKQHLREQDRVGYIDRTKLKRTHCE